MSKFTDRMVKATSGIRKTRDIPESELPVKDEPSTGGGALIQLAQAKLRIRELEESLSSSDSIQLELIDPNRWQPRIKFDVEALDRLTLSIQTIGVMTPVIVRKTADSDRYELVAGERRLRASKAAGLSHIPVKVTDVSDSMMAMLALGENINREDLHDYEIAKSLIQIAEEYPSKGELAEAYGYSRTKLSKFLRFSKLPDFIISDLEQNNGLLGVTAVEQIMNVLDMHGAPAMSLLKTLWPRVVSGEVMQMKVAESLLASLKRKVHTPVTSGSTEVLYRNGKEVGVFKNDGKNFSLRIKSKLLTEEDERKLQKYLKSMFQ